MDEKPFLELDLLDIDEHVVPELSKLSKASFDVESIINAAGELKYVSQIKKVIAGLLASPTEDFVRLIASTIYDGMITAKVREQFTELTRKAARQFLNDQVNDRLKSAMTGAIPHTSLPNDTTATDEGASESEDDDGDKINTTIEEVEGFHIVKAIVRESVNATRIVMRDTQSYCGILLDDNNRKPICRLHFNRAQKYIGLFDEAKNETRHPIETLDQIYAFADHLKKTALGYA
jgi:hypothetical protein